MTGTGKNETNVLAAMHLQPNGLEEAFAELREQLNSLAQGQLAPRPGDGTARTSERLDILAHEFDLSPFEEGVVLLAAFTELEPDAEALIGSIQGDARLARPSVGLALSLVDGAHWSGFAPQGPLRKFAMISLEGNAVVSQTFKISERILHHLVALDEPDEILSMVAGPIASRHSLPTSAERVMQDLTRHIGLFDGMERGPMVALCGPGQAGKTDVVAAAAKRNGGRAYLMYAGDVPSGARDRMQLARIWAREWRLTRAVVSIDLTDTSAPIESAGALNLAQTVDAPVVLLAPDPPMLAHRSVVRLDLQNPPAAEQTALWRGALGPLADRLDGTLERVTSHFTLSLAAISSIAEDAANRAETNDSDRGDQELGETLWQACRQQARPRLDELAQRIEGMATWQDIVLPTRQRETLDMLAAQVRMRTRVYEEWGFGANGKRGLGINALFAGPSGTGKTLAAEILGNTLDLDIYRIDLSAVVSKWIGETEKNLRRIFDAAQDCGTILLFDEADALFGKRSDVKDSHDRYANIEVSYLLQRMEAYRGLAILTTNMKSHIDDAFARRIRFLVEFPFPSATERVEIWQRAFPPQAERENLDWPRLAQFNLAGGNIRNIAVNAAFLAADAGQRISMDHIRVAACGEYTKLGRPLTKHELAGWPEPAEGEA